MYGVIVANNCQDGNHVFQISQYKASFFYQIKMDFTATLWKSESKGRTSHYETKSDDCGEQWEFRIENHLSLDQNKYTW